MKQDNEELEPLTAENRWGCKEGESDPTKMLGLVIIVTVLFWIGVISYFVFT